MLSLIAKEKMLDYHQSLRIDYNDYLRWLDDDQVKCKYYLISTSNIDLRDQSVWNQKGREIYNLDKIHKHAEKVNTILEDQKLKAFLIQHEYRQFIWFPEWIAKDERAESKIAFIKSRVPEIDINAFDGAFRIDNELPKFVYNFIDYPFLFNYRDIDCISLDSSLIVKINHHLSVDFVTIDSSIAKNIISLCNELDLNYLTNEKSP